MTEREDIQLRLESMKLVFSTIADWEISQEKYDALDEEAEKIFNYCKYGLKA